MKHKKVLLIALICLIGIGVSALLFSGQRPFKDLEATDITSANVRLSPPDTTIQISETEELVSYLKEVVIYNKDNSYTEYAGQGAVFTLFLADGSQMKIIAFNPFIIIDGIGYKCKYEPCEALNNYANRLLTDNDTTVIQSSYEDIIGTKQEFFQVKNNTSEQNSTELQWDIIPMVMVNNKLYYDTGKESTLNGRCGVMDGKITSTVDGSEIPTKNDQSNFGTGFKYQYGSDDTIEIFMNEKWIIFEQRDDTET